MFPELDPFIIAEQIKNAPLSQKIDFWGVVVSAVIMIAAIAEVFVAYLIAASINRATRQSESLEASRRIYQQWQDFNVLVITNSEFRNAHRDLEQLPDSDGEIQKKYLLFYVLNVIYSAYSASKLKRDDLRQADRQLSDHLQILKCQQEAVLEILRGGRGYDDEFVKKCEEILK